MTGSYAVGVWLGSSGALRSVQQELWSWPQEPQPQGDTANHTTECQSQITHQSDSCQSYNNCHCQTHRRVTAANHAPECQLPIVHSMCPSAVHHTVSVLWQVLVPPAGAAQRCPELSISLPCNPQPCPSDCIVRSCCAPPVVVSVVVVAGGCVGALGPVHRGVREGYHLLPTAQPITHCTACSLPTAAY